MKPFCAEYYVTCIKFMQYHGFVNLLRLSLYFSSFISVIFRCSNYSGTVCRPVIGSGPVFVDTSSEAAFANYKMNFTRLGVTIDATCEAFLRMQYCGLSTLSCTGQAHCGPYTDTQIGVCGVNACKCPRLGCSAGLEISFRIIGGGLGYYVTGKQPQGTNCTEFNIRKYASRVAVGTF